MSKALRLDAEAEEEIAHAIDRYEDEREGLGLEFWTELSAAMDTLDAPGPECGPVIGLPPELGVRCCRDNHRAERGTPQPAWASAAYWLCWLGLPGLAVAMTTTRSSLVVVAHPVATSAATASSQPRTFIARQDNAIP